MINDSKDVTRSLLTLHTLDCSMITLLPLLSSDPTTILPAPPIVWAISMSASIADSAGWGEWEWAWTFNLWTTGDELEVAAWSTGPLPESADTFMSSPRWRWWGCCCWEVESPPPMLEGVATATSWPLKKTAPALLEFAPALALLVLALLILLLFLGDGFPETSLP